MEEQALKAWKKAEKKKRKAEGKPEGQGSRSKRQTAANDSLKSVQAKDAALRLGSKPIFVQPPNLSTD